MVFPRRRDMAQARALTSRWRGTSFAFVDLVSGFYDGPLVGPVIRTVFSPVPTALIGAALDVRVSSVRSPQARLLIASGGERRAVLIADSCIATLTALGALSSGSVVRLYAY